MRSDVHEPGRGFLTAATKSARCKPNVLQASAVDAALDDLTPLVMPLNARRDAAAASSSGETARATMSESRPLDAMASSEGNDGQLLRQLSRQLSLLEVQQQQIRRLLEQTEQRGSRAATRIDR